MPDLPEQITITEYYFPIGDKVFRVRRFPDGSLQDIEEVPMFIMTGYRSNPWPHDE